MPIQDDTHVQAHGMGTECVEPHWQPMTLEEVNLLLRSYPELAPASALLWHSPRPFSSATIAVSGDAQIFVKRHHRSVRDAEGLMEEHRFMKHLRQNGLPVNEAYLGVQERTAQQIGEWTYEVYSLAKGSDLYRDAHSWTPFTAASHAYAAGQMLARLHLASAGYTAPPRTARTLVSSFRMFAAPDPLSALRSYAGERTALAAYLSKQAWEQEIGEALLPFHARLLPLLEGLAPLWTHNDWHASNLLWNGTDEAATVETVLDFGLADCTYAVYDLATAIERNSISWLELGGSCREIVHFGQLEALLDGYEAIRPLSRHEARALAAILPLVHAEYALCEIDYFAGIVRSEDNADLAYGEYLLGHARWFNSGSGRKLLEYLERRAALPAKEVR